MYYLHIPPLPPKLNPGSAAGIAQSNWLELSVTFIITFSLACTANKWHVVFVFCTFIIFNSVTVFRIEGFKLGSEKHTTEAIVKKSGAILVTSGIEGLALLKTTKVSSFLFHVQIAESALCCTSKSLLLVRQNSLPCFSKFLLLSTLRY